MLKDHNEDRDDNPLKKGSISQETEVFMETQFNLVHEARSVVLREASRRSLDLEAMLGLHLQVFELDQLMIGGQTANLGNDRKTFLFAPLGHKPTGTGRHKHDANTKSKSRSHLDANRNQPGSVRLTGAGATDVVCAVS